MTTVELGDEGKKNWWKNEALVVTVGAWNDDEVTQQPHSRTHSFSLLAINCHSIVENASYVYSKPISAKQVYTDV